MMTYKIYDGKKWLFVTDKASVEFIQKNKLDVPHLYVPVYIHKQGVA